MGITNSAIRQKLGKLCKDFCEDNCLAIIQSLQTSMVETYQQTSVEHINLLKFVVMWVLKWNL